MSNVVSDHDDSDYEAKPKKRRKFVKKITKIEVKKTFKLKHMKKIPDNYEDCVKMLEKMSERWKDGKKWTLLAAFLFHEFALAIQKIQSVLEEAIFSYKIRIQIGIKEDL